MSADFEDPHQEVIDEPRRVTPPPSSPTYSDLVEFVQGKIRLCLHPGQRAAWDSLKRFIAVIAGTQSGKTSFGPPWLLREMKSKGPGDYLVVTPSFQLCDKKVLPAFQRLFEKKLKLGTYIGHKKKFIFSPEGSKFLFGYEPEEETVVFFGHAAQPDSLESATAKAAWLDEAGQNLFRLGSWEAIQRRLSMHMGRALITTTPYNLGWLKQKLYDPWIAADKNHPEIEVIRFDSTENPAFPQQEFERACRELPRWKFDLFFRGIFTRPAGLIYDSFDERIMKIPPFELKPHWTRYLGLDFGGINTCGVFLAEEPVTKRLYVYREYFPRVQRTAKQHVEAIMQGEPRMPMAFGGAKSEGQWRAEFQAAGLPVSEPNIMEATDSGRSSSIVEVGINRVYAAFQKKEIFIFDTLRGLLDELLSYSWKTDEAGNVSEEIDAKEMYHFCDALRYIVGHIRRPYSGKFEFGLPPPGRGNCVEMMPEGVFLEPLRSRWWDQQW